MKTILSTLRIIREFRRTYIVLNLVYYGLVVFGMVYVAFNPSLQQLLLDAVGSAFTEGPLSAVGGAYSGGQVLLAIVLTFGLNLAIASFLWITLPSLVIPFSGLLTGACRAVLWGLLFSPSSPEMSMVMIPHSLTLILEGQAYILAMLAAYIQGKAFLWPGTVDATTHTQGYLAGVKRSLRLYLLVAIVLAVAAVYEVVEVIFVIPLFGGIS
jgi:hypothetical protein